MQTERVIGMGDRSEYFRIGDVVRHKKSGLVGKVAKFAHDGTTDFWDENGTGPYKQDDFEKLVPARAP